MILTMFCLFSACATSEKQEYRDAVSEMVEADRYVDEDENLPDLSRFKIGMSNGRVYSRGEAELPINNSRSTVERAAIMDGETKLLSEAPSDFRILTQNALTSAGVDAGEFYQIQSKIQTVVGVTGISYDARKTMCKKLIKNDGFETNVSRVCWVQVHIPLNELIKAYKRTLALKFGQNVAEQFKAKMDNEVKKLEQTFTSPKIQEPKQSESNSSIIKRSIEKEEKGNENKTNKLFNRDIVFDNVKSINKNSNSPKLSSNPRSKQDWKKSR